MTHEQVRTGLCVLESFGRETAVPFLFQQKGGAWVPPLHETSETYLAGVAFMVGATFILHGSTKVVAASRPQLCLRLVLWGCDCVARGALWVLPAVALRGGMGPGKVNK